MTTVAIASRDLVATFTSVGLGAVASADALGVKARVTQIAIGRGYYAGNQVYQGYEPQRGQVALLNEFMRAPIGEADDIAANEVALAALFEADAQPGSEGFVYEVGFFLDDGTLLCLWSELGNRPLCHRQSGVSLIVALTLLVEAIPRDRLNFIVSGPSISIINLLPAVLSANASLRIINELTRSKVDQYTPIIQSTY